MPSGVRRESVNYLNVGRILKRSLCNCAKMPTAPAARVLPHPGNNAWQLRSPSGIRKRHGNIVHSERLPTACAASDLSSCSAGFSQLHPGTA